MAPTGIKRRLRYLVDINRNSLAESTPDDFEIKYLDISAVGTGHLVSPPVTVRFIDAPSRARRLVRPEDTIVSTVRTYLRAVWPVQGDTERLVVSTGFAVLTPRPALYHRYLGWVCQCTDFVEEVVARSTGISYPAINSTEIGDIRVPVPELSTQQAISGFLEHQTGKIDSLVNRQKRMVDLLHSRAISTISEEFEDLRLNASLIPVKQLVSEQDHRNTDDLHLDLLSVSIHKGVVLREEITDKLPRADDLGNYKVCRRGDIIINRMRAFQGGVGEAQRDGLISPDYAILRPGPRVDSRYLHHVFRSSWFVGEMTARLKGIGNSDQGNVRTPRINFAELGPITIPVPTLGVQRTLAARWDRIVELNTKAANLIDRQVQCLEERRIALINAALDDAINIPGGAYEHN